MDTRELLMLIRKPAALAATLALFMAPSFAQAQWWEEEEGFAEERYAAGIYEGEEYEGEEDWFYDEYGAGYEEGYGWGGFYGPGLGFGEGLAEGQAEGEEERQIITLPVIEGEEGFGEEDYGAYGYEDYGAYYDEEEFEGGEEDDGWLF